MNWALLQNSLLVSGLTTLLATGFGLLAALWLVGLDTRWRNRLLAVTVVALVLPPFLATNCWLDLLGTTGAWRSWLPLNIYSLGGAVWILALLLWPIPLLIVLSAWSQIEPAQLESDPLLRSGALLRWLLWPMARERIGQAAVVVFVLALNNFAVPTLLQVKVFPAEMWLRFSTGLNESAAWAASWPLIVAPVLLLLALRRSQITWPRTEGPVTARAFRRLLGGAWHRCAGAVTLGLLGLSVGLPLVQLVGTPRTWAELPNLLRAAPDVIWNSALFALVAATLCALAGLLTWKLRVGLILWLPFLIPGVLLGRGLIFIFLRPELEMFYGTQALVVLAFAVRYAGPAWNLVAQALRGVNRDLTDAARMEGASGWALLRHVYWPQIAPQVGAAWYVTFLLCLWDVETLVLIYPPGGETLALRIFNLLHYGHSAQVNALCVVLLGLAVAPLLVWMATRRFEAK